MYRFFGAGTINILKTLNFMFELQEIFLWKSQPEWYEAWRLKRQNNNVIPSKVKIKLQKVIKFRDYIGKLFDTFLRHIGRSNERKKESRKFLAQKLTEELLTRRIWFVWHSSGHEQKPWLPFRLIGNLTI